MKQHFGLRTAAACLACALAALPCASLPQTAEAVDAQAKEYAEIMVSAVNDARVEYGLSELAIVPVLLDASSVRAQELETQFGHYRPDGSACFTALAEHGVTYNLAAENVAAGRADALGTFSQWMASEGHRANILGEGYTHIGIGYYYDPDSTYKYHWSMFLIGSYDGSQPYVYEDQYLPERVLGDVNGSKTINSSDAAFVLQYTADTAAGLSHPVVSDFRAAADVNGDKTVNSVDASIILTYTAATGSGSSVELNDFLW